MNVGEEANIIALAKVIKEEELEGAEDAADTKKAVDNSDTQEEMKF